MANHQQRIPYAKKSLGQNFLTDESVIQRIIGAFDPKPVDVVLEIGPGRGALTQVLVDRAGQVYALEFDRDLARILLERFSGKENFTLIEDDALNIDFATISPGAKMRLIANLPYNISTAILQRLFDYPKSFVDCVLMFQREVVDRMIAAPGTKDRGYLTVMVEASFDVEKLFDVSPNSFRPAPKIWSSVVRLWPKEKQPAQFSLLKEVVAAGFAQKRKTILNNLKLKYPNVTEVLSVSRIDPARRAETLTLAEWERLTSAIGSSPAPL